MIKRAAIFTLGCRANQFDGQVIANSLMDSGFEIVDFNEFADLYVINTCTVTHRGDADSRKAVRNALRRNPNAFIVIAGCYPQWGYENLKRIDGIDLIIGNREKFNITDYLPSNLTKQIKPLIIISDPTFDDSFGTKPIAPIDRSRALLKIQDGCDRSCSYCIVPKVRGKSRSLKKSEVISRINALNEMGFKEIVLTGINLGCWGKDIDDSLELLIKEIEKLDGDFRIRLSSIEPMELNASIVETILESSKIARHLHVPLQSACERILAEMGRSGTLKKTMDLLEKIKSFDSGWNIGTDIIIGYPGENETDFKEQLENLSKLPIDYFHLFTYSPRKGTKAFKNSAMVPQAQIKSRLEILKSIDRACRKKFIKSQIGQILNFILEHKRLQKNDIIMGLSDNYIRAKIEISVPPPSAVVRARLAEVEDVPKAILISQVQ